MTHSQLAIAMWRHFGACDRECAVCRFKFRLYGLRIGMAIASHHDAQRVQSQVHGRLAARVRL